MQSFSIALITESLELLPLILSVILCFGTLKIYIYYKAFKIRIYSFIDIKETLNLFIENVIAYSVISLLTLFSSLLFLNNVIKTEQYKSKNIWGLISTHIRQNDMLYIILGLLILILGYKLLRKNISWIEAIMQIFVVLIWLLLIPVIVFKFGLEIFNTEAKTNYIWHVVLSSCTAFVIYLAATVINEIYKVKYKFYFKGSEFKINNEDKSSTEQFYYVGQSQKYIFFYNNETSCSEIYPISKVTWFRFKR